MKPLKCDLCEFVIFPLPAGSFPVCALKYTGKIAMLKKTIFSTTFLSSVPARLFLKRCGVTVVWERMSMSDATRKTVLKQATQRVLFRGVTFWIGWSYFWKNVWAQNTFPFIIWFLKACAKSGISCCCNLWWGRACVCVKCTVVRLAFSFKCLFLVVHIELLGELYYLQGNVFLVCETSL